MSQCIILVSVLLFSTKIVLLIYPVPTHDGTPEHVTYLYIYIHYLYITFPYQNIIIILGCNSPFKANVFWPYVHLFAEVNDHPPSLWVTVICSQYVVPQPLLTIQVWITVRNLKLPKYLTKLGLHRSYILSENSAPTEVRTSSASRRTSTSSSTP